MFQSLIPLTPTVNGDFNLQLVCKENCTAVAVGLDNMSLLGQQSSC